jgi:hypothetical protein
MLCSDPAQRATPQELLNHPWLQSMARQQSTDCWIMMPSPSDQLCVDACGSDAPAAASLVDKGQLCTADAWDDKHGEITATDDQLLVSC